MVNRAVRLAKQLDPGASVWVDLRYVIPGLDVAITRPFTGPDRYQATAYHHGKGLVAAKGSIRLSALIAVLQEVEKKND